MQMDMRMDAVKQERKAFKEDRERSFLAMRVIFDVTKFVYKNGFAVLSKDEQFRGGQPHILDLMEKREHIEVPLKRYLSFGLDCVSMGTDSDEMEELLANRCCAGSYAGSDAVIAYIYALGISGMQEVQDCSYILNCFRSIVPDEEGDEFETFSVKLLEDYSSVRRTTKFRMKEELKLL